MYVVSAFRRTTGIRYPERVFPAPDSQAPDPDTDAPRSEIKQRLVAFIEVLICSDVPTQLAISATLVALGYRPYGSSGQLQVAFVVGLSLVDAAVLIGLIVLFLYSHGESPRAVLFGRRRIVDEIAYGVPLTLIVLGAGLGMLLAIQYFVPWLHSVQDNPLEGLLQSPRDAWLFGLVVLVAGGVREEIQRAFLLHRFEVWLGGGTVGVIITSVAFGAGHLLQGYDAAIVTGLLGAFWGVIYLRRRSAVAPMVSHAGFDLLQIVQSVTMRT
jgi:membrane protease YdiL (CAAX protease family)